jgi:hypothetical protein
MLVDAVHQCAVHVDALGCVQYVDWQGMTAVADTDQYEAVNI